MGVGDIAEATVVMSIMAIATAGLHLPCTRPTGTPDTTPPTGMPEITTRAGVAGDTPHTDLLMVVGQEGSALDLCSILPTECLKEATGAVPVAVAVAMTGKVCSLPYSSRRRMSKNGPHAVPDGPT